jgi:hypothetical protein
MYSGGESLRNVLGMPCTSTLISCEKRNRKCDVSLSKPSSHVLDALDDQPRCWPRTGLSARPDQLSNSGDLDKGDSALGYIDVH